MCIHFVYEYIYHIYYTRFLARKVNETWEAFSVGLISCCLVSNSSLESETLPLLAIGTSGN